MSTESGTIDRWRGLLLTRGRGGALNGEQSSGGKKLTINALFCVTRTRSTARSFAR